MSSKLKNPAFSLAVFCSLLIIIFLTVFPYIWLFLSSFKLQREMFQATKITFLPKHPTLENYWNLFFLPGYERPVPRAFLNSIVVGLITSVLSASFGALAGYSFATLELPGKKIMLSFIIAILAIPPICLTMPLFITMKNLGLTDTWLALILPYAALQTSLSTWIMTGFFRNMPQALRDAGLIDGCSEVGVFLKIILPVSAPGFVTCMILAFIFCWNEFMLALILTFTPAAKTLPVVAAETVTSESIEWGMLTALGVIVAMPAATFVLIFQKNIIKGLLTGAVKE